MRKLAWSLLLGFTLAGSAAQARPERAAGSANERSSDRSELRSETLDASTFNKWYGQKMEKASAKLELRLEHLKNDPEGVRALRQHFDDSIVQLNRVVDQMTSDDLVTRDEVRSFRNSVRELHPFSLQAPERRQHSGRSAQQAQRAQQGKAGQAAQRGQKAHGDRQKGQRGDRQKGQHGGAKRTH